VSACHVDSKLSPAPAHPYDVWESEPNDAHCCAHDLGWLSVGDQFVLGGTIRDDGLDPFDGFRLRSSGPCSVRFVLQPLDGVSDLDLCVWDPLLNDFAFCFESGAQLEQGVFNVHSSGAAFHLVVASYIGRSEYRLWISCEPIGLGLNAGEAPPARAPSPKANRFNGYGAASENVALESSLGPLWVVEYDADSDQVDVQPGAWWRAMQADASREQ
jgi:hypothetical protein